MVNTKPEPAEPGRRGHQDAELQSGTGSEPARSSMSKSMHDGVEVWCDCCSCEAEPYWIEAMAKDQESADNSER